MEISPRTSEQLASAVVISTLRCNVCAVMYDLQMWNACTVIYDLQLVTDLYNQASGAKQKD